MLSVEEARMRILSTVEPLASERVSLKRAVGRVLAEHVLADSDLPAFDNSSVDGFAVRAEQIAAATSQHPIEMPVSSDIPAGTELAGTLQAGTAARIMTGAPLPGGADSVVMLEDTDFDPRKPGSPSPARVAVFHAAVASENVRSRGADVHAGETVLSPGRRLRAADIGLLAALGRSMIDVHRRPRLAIFSTGDELLRVGAPAERGKIWESNSFSLAALAQEAGAEVLRLGIARDRPAEVEELLGQAVQQRADLILSSAGVSVGAFDFVREVIASRGSLDFWRINMRPGKPLAYGAFDNIPFFGLPGNPVSAFICFLIFVSPVVARLSGAAETPRRLVRARLVEPVHSDGRETYLRAIVDASEDGPVARLTGHQGSADLFALSRANALLIIPSGVKSVPPGEEVTAWLL
jgi:molybdopterin molybdotransferase